MKAEELGVEVFPGYAGADVIYDENGAVSGVITGDMGITKSNQPGDMYMRGMEIRAKQTIFAEGCRGSLTEKVKSSFKLAVGKDPQTYGIGLKEIWQVKDENCVPGFVQHSLGWPLPHDVYGGSFLYHMAPNLVHLGLIVGLGYKNPHLNPYEEF